MAKYTTELRTLLDINYDIGLASYPIFDEDYRNLLNKKITNHYKFREIGLETPALFRHFLSTRMNEIMPYYNQLYNSAKIKIEPFLTYQRKQESEKNTTDQSNETIDRDISRNINQNEESDRTLKSDIKVDGNSDEKTSGSRDLDGSSTTDSDSDTVTSGNSRTTTDGNSKTTNNTESSGKTTDNYEETTDGHDSTASTTSSNIKDVHSATPAGLLTIGNIANQVYADDARFTNTAGNDSDAIDRHNALDHNGNGTSENNTNSTSTTTNDGNVDVDNTGDSSTTASTDTNNEEHEDIDSETTSNFDSDTNRNDTENNTKEVTVTDKNTDDTKRTSNATGYEKLLGSSYGFEGISQSDLIIKHRNTFLNIDLMIINELNDLFMNIF